MGRVTEQMGDAGSGFVKAFALVALLVGLTIQVGVPICGIFTDACSRDRWTWSMYSGHRTSFEYHAVVEDEIRPIDAGAELGIRGWIPYGSSALVRLCGRHPEADEIVRSRLRGGRVEAERRWDCDP